MPCCTVVLHTAAILVPDHQNEYPHGGRSHCSVTGLGGSVGSMGGAVTAVAVLHWAAPAAKVHPVLPTLSLALEECQRRIVMGTDQLLLSVLEGRQH